MSHGTINYVPVVDWLTGKAGNVYTQFGEDGLIDAIFDRIGKTNCHCFEIGASDGRFFSNTLLRRERGWFAVLIESDEASFVKLKRDFGNESICIHETCGDLDRTLRLTRIDKRPDLGIIDIDGQDYWLWHDLTEYTPRVMLVEIAINDPTTPIPERNQAGQAGLNAIEELGKQKGYSLVAHTYCNAIFVHDSETEHRRW